MKQSVKDEMFKALKELTCNRVYPYRVLKIDRNCDYDSDNVCKWEIRVIPERGFIANVRQIVDTAQNIESTIVVTLTHDEKSYLSFI